jgi:sn-glycerol 3-phosphate transport system substrate-binding protein
MKSRNLVLLIVLALTVVFTAGEVMAKRIEITWWHAMRSARGEVVNTMIKAFNDSQDQVHGHRHQQGQLR